MNPATPTKKTKVALRPDLIVARYSEIFLKGDNRPVFETCLEKNIRRALQGLEDLVVEKHYARLMVRTTGPNGDLEAALTRVTRVFGVASASIAYSSDRNLENLGDRAVALVKQAADGGARSFRLRSRRSDKRFHLTSPQLNEIIGQRVKDSTGLRVDLDTADVTVTIEIGPDLAFVTVHSAAGPGGLPVGVSGKVLLLLSGGIDSPVAGYLCQKRGCKMLAVYFHSHPYTGEAAKQKVQELARELASAQGGIRLAVVSFTDLQELFRDRANPRHLVILYRRAMMRIACRIAQIEGALAIATGENLGQVASQTLENLRCIEDVADCPVLRPVITYDKAEIIRLAKHMGTYEISIRPHQDSCSLFVPKHPVTKGRSHDLEAVERRLDLEPLLERAVSGREIIDLED